MISVYITSFNKGKFIGQAIDSVLNQSLRPGEIIIVDDGSIDNSREIITTFKNRYPDLIKRVFNEYNLGISKTRNIALQHCSGDIITYLDGDDLFYPNKLLFEYDLLSSQEKTSVVYSNFSYIDEFNNRIGVFSENNDTPVTGDILFETFLRQYNVTSGNNYIYEMYYKNCAENIGNYDENIRLWEDWDFRIRMSNLFHYDYCCKINSAYRKLKTGMHNLGPDFHYREQIKIYKKNKHIVSKLRNKKKDIIHHNLYSKCKILIIKILKNNLIEKNYFRYMKNLFEFIWTFRMIKAVKYLYSQKV